MSVALTIRRVVVPVALLAAWPLSARCQVGAIRGVVWDSIDGAPLADAAVFLWDTPHRAVTDDEGRFEITGVPSGDYQILFFHTRLGEMGVSPGPRAVTLGADPLEDIRLATPSMATVVSGQCLMEDGPPGSGAIAGRVFDGESGVAMGGATVTLSWHDDVLSPPRSRVTRVGSDGWFRSCGVPPDVAVLVSAEFVGRGNRRREVMVEAGGYTEAEVALYSLATSRVSGHLVDGQSNRPVEGAETWLRGTGFRALTDNDGDFTFADVPSGTYMLMTDHLAYGTKMDTLDIPEGQRLLVEMRLDTRPIEIAPLSVSIEAPRVAIDRRRGGILITRAQIESVRQQSRDASDVLRSLHLPGVIVRHQSNGVICVGYITGQVKMNQNGCVEMMVYINDVRATDSDLALRLPPDAIDRMVIYKPVEAGNLFGLGGGNGVWMIYTR